MKRILKWLVLTVISLTVMAGCSIDTYDGHIGQDRYLDSLASVFSRYATAGHNDSVIMMAERTMKEAMAEEDTLKILCSCLFAAQSWLYAENTDSVRYCLDVARDYIGYCDSPFLNIMYNNVYGSYSIRAGLDYALALDSYLDGLRWAEQSSSTSNQAVMLLNIANIFYMQGSADGYSYAENALELVRGLSHINSYVKSAAYINMSQMQYLMGRTADARNSLDTAWTMVKGDRIYSLYSPIKVLDAQLYEERGDVDQAALSFEEAVEYSRYTDHGTMSYIYLQYGNFLMRERHLAAALENYRKGLEISEESRSMEFHLELLGRMADCCWRTGDKETSLEYYRKYSDFQDSLSEGKQHEFNQAVLSLKEMEHDREQLRQELVQQRHQHKVRILSTAVVLTVIVVIMAFMLYNRKRKEYDKLVEQHQYYVQKLEQEKKLYTVAPSPSKELFQKIEDLMCREKYFMRKGITLEDVAEKVNTNRTYCSKAINTFAGCSFYKWLDTLRIAEATRRIVEDNGILFKQLAEDLGYSSMSAFSKAFVNEIGCTPSNYREAFRKRPRKEPDKKIVSS